LIIIIIATLAQSLCAGSPAVSIVGVIIFWRVIMGIGKIVLPLHKKHISDLQSGIGGDYPLSSIITSE
jgi:PHS family inorganic phosphate transporter-like MFS transporter